MKLSVRYHIQTGSGEDPTSYLKSATDLYPEEVGENIIFNS
jgi:hypothetical protein